MNENEMTQRELFEFDCKAAADDSRVLSFVGSTPTRDRVGDEILATGWDVKQYKRNPVFLWGHNSSEPENIIGRSIAVEKSDSGLVFDVEFAPAEVNPKAEQVFQLYKMGFLRAVSVGFRSKDSEWIAEDSDEEDGKNASKNRDERPGKLFKKVELLELSAVPVPCNPEALMTARRKGLDVPAELGEKLDAWALDRSVSALANTRAIRERIERIYEMTCGASEGDDDADECETTQPAGAIAKTDGVLPAVQPPSAVIAETFEYAPATDIATPKDSAPKTGDDTMDENDKKDPAMTPEDISAAIAAAVEKSTEALRVEMQEQAKKLPSPVPMQSAEMKDRAVPAEAVDPVWKSFTERVDKVQEKLGHLHKVPENEFSFSRLFNALCKRDWSSAPLERFIQEKTAPLRYGTVGDGGYWVPAEYLPEQFIEYYRANLIADKVGVTTIQATGAPVNIPKITAGATTYWIAENAAITASTTETAGQLQLVPHFLVARTQISEFLNQVSAPTAEAIVRMDIAKSLANEVDDTILEGVPTSSVPGRPAGVSSCVAGGNVVALGTHGGTLTFAKLREMEYKLQVANIPTDGWAWVMHPRTWNALVQREQVQYSGQTVGGGFYFRANPEQNEGRSLFGYPVHLTTNLAINLTKGTASSGGINLARLFLGKWSDAIICEWGGLNLKATDVGGNAWANNYIEVKATKVMDFGLRHTTSFAAIADSQT